MSILSTMIITYNILKNIIILEKSVMKNKKPGQSKGKVAQDVMSQMCSVAS